MVSHILRCRKGTNCTSDGFSLIEVAIALTVIGILLASVLQIYNLYAAEQIRLESKSKIQTVQSALYRYIYRYGRYPLPAPRNVAIGSAAFGREATAPVTVDCSSGAAAAGSVCVTSSGTVDTSADADALPDNVLIGDVPFATLGIRYNNIIDPWGEKLVYAVTESMTAPGSSDNWGAVEVLDVNGNSVFSAGAQRAHFFVYSSGPDQKGSFGQGGVLSSICTSVAGTDQENCDRDGVFRSNQDMSTQAKLSQIYSGSSVSHFDDYLYYTDSSAAGIWTRLAATTPGQVNIASTNSQNIKIGAFPTSAPTTCSSECTTDCGGNAACLATCSSTTCKTIPRTKMDVEGAVRASQLNTDRICDDYTIAGCTSNLSSPIPYGVFGPRNIGGTPTTGLGTIAEGSPNYRNRGGGFLCRSNMAMRGINDIEELCAYTTYFSSQGSMVTPCASGYYAKGINSDGSLCCSDAASCY